MALYQPFRQAQGDDGFSSEYAVREAERSLNILLRLYFMRHSFEATDVYIASPLSKLSSLCLKIINESPSTHELEGVRSTLALVLNGLVSQAQNTNIPRAVLKLVKNSIPQAEMEVIQRRENVSAYGSDEVEDYTMGELHSSWTPTVVSISDGPKSKELTKLLALTTNDVVAAAADRSSQ